MPNKILGSPLLQITVGVFLFIVALSAINLYILPRHVFIALQEWRAYDWFLLESLFVLPAGGMLMIGSGGLNYQTLKSAVELSQTNENKASEIFRQNRFRTSGFLRMGLIFVISGIILLALFLSSL